jgi:hypothetical protein
VGGSEAADALAAQEHADDEQQYGGGVSTVTGCFGLQASDDASGGVWFDVSTRGWLVSGCR